MMHGTFIFILWINIYSLFSILVGTNAGEIITWNLMKRKRNVTIGFEIWNNEFSIGLQDAPMDGDRPASVNRVVWCPNGTLLAVAYSKRILHVYSYSEDNGLRNYHEIEAHEGSVNDVVFSNPNGQLSIITCGDDRLIKVWDALTGDKNYTFVGHETPVYSVCSRQKRNTQFIFSVGMDGMIRRWWYSDQRCDDYFPAPGYGLTKMASSLDEKRLFSSGSGHKGSANLGEWREGGDPMKRKFVGLEYGTTGIVKFDTLRDKYVVAGNGSKIKFWNMNDMTMVTSTEAGGGLAPSPCLRFNKDGNLLAVSTSDNGVKILANITGSMYLCSVGSYRFLVPRLVPSAIRMQSDLAEPLVPTTICDQSQCRVLKLIDDAGEGNASAKISMLMYGSSGRFIMALAANGVHKVWKSTSIKELKSTSPILMIGDVRDKNQEDAVSCFASMRNDSYLASCSGGNVTFFDMMTYTPMRAFIPPPPAVTFMACDPEDNNIIALGMEDSSIRIYNFLLEQVTAKLEGHQKRITSLVFSAPLKVLVSAAADSQICVWTTDSWEKQTDRHMTALVEPETFLSNTSVQFHRDQIRMLLVHNKSIGVFKAPRLQCVNRILGCFRAVDFSSERCQISVAAYSCDYKSVFVGFKDGVVGIFDAERLKCKCRISPFAYTIRSRDNSRQRAHPVAIAGYPSRHNQIALGLDDGGVIVLEPSGAGGEWGDENLESHV